MKRAFVAFAVLLSAFTHVMATGKMVVIFALATFNSGAAEIPTRRPCLLVPGMEAA
ncbi:MAG: hypothetical protein M3Y08_13415 [Fibrobacterota bacterium]|nr:hypothetical protein [Fibrobacterota bacterium]